jgi:DNA-binding MarR family transcriptional regulator
MESLMHSDPTGPRDVSERREDVLLCVSDNESDYAAHFAYDLNVPLSTVRSDLRWLEDHGYVVGTKHDERDILYNGRVRVYWSVTEKGAAYIAAMTPERRRGY